MHFFDTYLHKGFEGQTQQMADKAERFRFMLIQCFVFALPFDRVYSSVVLILLAILTLFGITKKRLQSLPWQMLIFQVCYLLSLFGYFYSFHRSNAGFVLEKQLAILLFPLILPLAVDINERKMHTTLKTLTVSVIIANIYLFFCVIWEALFELQMPLREALSSGLFFNHRFSQPLQIHAGYLSIYTSLSVIYLIRSFRRNMSLFQKASVILSLIILFAGLFFLASRNTLLALGFILLFVIPFYRLKKRKVYFIIVALIISVSFLVVNKVPYLKQRFSSEMVMDLNSNVGALSVENFKVLEPRYDRWVSGMDLVESSPLIGYGTGDEESMLKTAYIHHGLYISYILAFNAHNQYLSILIKHGLIGLILFLAALFYYFRLAYLNQHVMYMSFLILLTIGFLTENILDANKGIFFFALFNTFFGYQCLFRKKY